MCYENRSIPLTVLSQGPEDRTEAIESVFFSGKNVLAEDFVVRGHDKFGEKVRLSSVTVWGSSPSRDERPAIFRFYNSKPSAGGDIPNQSFLGINAAVDVSNTDFKTSTGIDV